MGENPELLCPFCRTTAPRGARVCTGCAAEIVYGATNKEAGTGLLLGVVIGVMLPVIASNKLGFEPHGLLLLLGLFAGIAGALFVMHKLYNGNVRFFRQFQHGN